MNRIVREHYPVERLPEDLRVGLPREAFVTVTVQADRKRSVQRPAKRIADPDFFRRLRSQAPTPARTSEEISRYIAELRDD